MLTITIAGPQGCGKTILAAAISNILEDHNVGHVIHDGEETVLVPVHKDQPSLTEETTEIFVIQTHKTKESYNAITK